MANPVTTSDVEARWRPLSDAETTVAGQLIDDAWNILTASVVPSLEDWITATTVSAETVVRVVSNMVIRVMKNPNGYRSESLDDWTGVRDAALSAGELWPTEYEIASVQPRYIGLGPAYTVSLSG